MSLVEGLSHFFAEQEAIPILYVNMFFENDFLSEEHICLLKQAQCQ